MAKVSGPRVSADLPLAGAWTLGSFCEHLTTVKQWPEPPEWAGLMDDWEL